jgi:hypothetical protein
MARKRLTPLATASHAASPALPDAPGAHAAGLETKAFGVAAHVRNGPPIARVAGESAAEAALATLSAEVSQARAEGRLIVALALDEIDESHLVRDRVGVDEAEMAVLMTSLTERGQQTAIEVIDLGAAQSGARNGPRYGLISGWRRLMALRRLRQRTGEPRFATIKALVRRPETAPEAYRAMVDENEIRVGLSYWERARIAVQAAETGIYPTAQHALRDLFSAASRAKRSKIGSFVGIYAHLGEEGLRFPTALPERLGLQLAKALETGGADLVDRLREHLAMAAPDTAPEEQRLLTAVLDAEAAPAPKKSSGAASRSETRPPVRGQGGDIRVNRLAPDRLELAGPGVDAALEAALAAWLKERRGGQ